MAFCTHLSLLQVLYQVYTCWRTGPGKITNPGNLLEPTLFPVIRIHDQNRTTPLPGEMRDPVPGPLTYRPGDEWLEAGRSGIGYQDIEMGRFDEIPRALPIHIKAGSQALPETTRGVGDHVPARDGKIGLYASPSEPRQSHSQSGKAPRSPNRSSSRPAP
jgi:hypothetical protein